MTTSGNNRLRRVALVLLAALTVGASALAYQTREQDDAGAEQDSNRVEASGQLESSVLPAAEGLPDTEALSGAEDLSGSETETSPDESTTSTDAASTISVTTVASATTSSSTASSTSAPTDSATTATTTAPTTTAPTTTTTTLTTTTRAPTTTTTRAPTTTTTARTTTTTRAPTTTTTVTTTTIAPVSLVNGGFDANRIPRNGVSVLSSNQVSGWTSSSRNHELWPSGQNGVRSVNGPNFVELNVAAPTTIHQDFATTPGSTIRWSFSHRGRNGQDIMEVFIGPPGGRLTAVTTASSSHLNWSRYTGTFRIPAGQQQTRIAFRAASGGGAGNFLDAVSVSVE